MVSVRGPWPHAGWTLELVFPTQGNDSILDPPTYLYYMAVPRYRSLPSQNKWVPYADTEPFIRSDADRLWGIGKLEACGWRCATNPGRTACAGSGSFSTSSNGMGSRSCRRDHHVCRRALRNRLRDTNGCIPERPGSWPLRGGGHEAREFLERSGPHGTGSRPGVGNCFLRFFRP